MPTKAEILVALEQLGPSSRHIRDKLYELGIKGVRRDCAACPVARYLEGKFPNTQIKVTDFFITVGDVTFCAPTPIFNFIRNFDQRYYTDLEA